MDKIKHALHLDSAHTHTSQSTHTNNPEAVHETIRTERDKHEREEAAADEHIHDREVQEAQDPTQEFVPPTVVQAREPLSSFERESLNDAAHGTHHAPGPDMYGGTHIPEQELPRPHHEAQNTALRPSDPRDPTAMDGAPTDPTSAGDDYAI
ncbi:hypothetical protein OIV83_004466 [Microbotryomycetes sp. JL201]|nr:hypothetical protein OIV83_004466 [Microbotryomycetes sp. JL201]